MNQILTNNNDSIETYKKKKIEKKSLYLWFNVGLSRSITFCGDKNKKNIF